MAPLILSRLLPTVGVDAKAELFEAIDLLCPSSLQFYFRIFAIRVRVDGPQGIGEAEAQEKGETSAHYSHFVSHIPSNQTTTTQHNTSHRIPFLHSIDSLGE